MIPTVHGKNVGELARYVALAKDLGVTMNFSLLSCEPHDAVLGALLPGEAELRQLGRSLLELAEHSPSLAMDAPVGVNLSVKTNCGAGFRELSVAADGTIYPCHMLHYPQLAMGNAFIGSVADALKSDVSGMFRNLRVEEHEGCSDCRHMYLCGGGCRARSMFATGTLRSRDSYCAMIQEFFDRLGASMKASLDGGAR